MVISRGVVTRVIRIMGVGSLGGGVLPVVWRGDDVKVKVTFLLEVGEVSIWTRVGEEPSGGAGLPPGEEEGGTRGKGEVVTWEGVREGGKEIEVNAF